MSGRDRLCGLALCGALVLCGLRAGSRALGGAAAPLTGDGVEYRQIARHLARARTFAFEPVAAYASRAPLYPTFLVMTGEAPLAQALLVVWTAALAGALAWRTHSPPAGVLAAALVGLHPGLVGSASTIAIEPLFGLLSLCVAGALAAWLARPDARSAAALAAAIGASLWCRSTFLALPPLAALLALWAPRRAGAGRGRSAPLLLAAYLMLAPWAARNLARLGAWIPVERHAGLFNLFHASLGHVMGTGDVESEAAAAREISGWADMDSVEKDEALLRASRARIAAAPLAYARGCALRLFHLWKAHGLALSLAAWGLWRLRRRPEAWGLAAVGAYFSVHAGMGIAHRYALPALPPLLTLAACGLADSARLGELEAPRGEPLRAWTRAALALPLLLCLCALAGLAIEAERYARPMVSLPSGCPRAETRLGPWRGVWDAKRAVDRGVLFFQEDRLDEARACLEAALAREPSYAAAQLSLGAVLARSGDARRAGELFEAAVRRLEALGEEGPILESARSSRDSVRPAAR